jgi:hypothetical protein
MAKNPSVCVRRVGCSEDGWLGVWMCGLGWVSLAVGRDAERWKDTEGPQQSALAQPLVCVQEGLKLLECTPDASTRVR